MNFKMGDIIRIIEPCICRVTHKDDILDCYMKYNNMPITHIDHSYCSITGICKPYQVRAKTSYCHFEESQLELIDTEWDV